MIKLLVFLALVASSACATLRGDQTVCPEYRDMRCVTAPECSLDVARGCRVCQCSPANGDEKGTPRGPPRLPSGVPPDRRVEFGPDH